MISILPQGDPRRAILRKPVCGNCKPARFVKSANWLHAKTANRLGPRKVRSRKDLDTTFRALPDQGDTRAAFLPHQILPHQGRVPARLGPSALTVWATRPRQEEERVGGKPGSSGAREGKKESTRSQGETQHVKTYPDQLIHRGRVPVSFRGTGEPERGEDMRTVERYDTLFEFKLSRRQRDRLEEISRVQGVAMSQILREALDEKLARSGNGKTTPR